MPRGPYWKDEDLEYVRRTMHLRTKQQAEYLGRSLRSVQLIRKRFSTGRKEFDRPWTQDEWAVLSDTLGERVDLVAGKLDRSLNAVSQARLRLRKSQGITVGPRVVANVPQQELWDRPPGTYLEVVGCLLLEDEECMGSWMHAHGYESFEIKHEDIRGWTTLVCEKEK